MLPSDDEHGYWSMPHTPIFQEDDDFEDEVEQGMEDLEDEEDEEELEDDDDDYFEDDDDFDDEEEED